MSESEENVKFVLEYRQTKSRSRTVKFVYLIRTQNTTVDKSKTPLDEKNKIK